MAHEPIVNFPGVTKHFTRDNSPRKWILIDAQGQTVGRLATQISTILRGKHRPTYTKHEDAGDFVVVINASGLEFRGGKLDKKTYYKHTGYFGHLKTRSAREMMDTKPELVLRKAVYGMISGGALKYRMMKKLKIYAGAEHPHKAQNPELFKIER
ncbi:MAG: 50S ribosomal protein L13 [Deltaproteobacteria bacterium]|nr:50S ribosomal protein L13 [Deltaproteobacteria bacterium]